MEISAEIKGHFLSLYQMAIADGEFSQPEWIMLYKFAEERGISRENLDGILLSPVQNIPLPDKIEKRIEYLYDLAKMSWADKVIDEDERSMLRKFAKKFEFIDENINSLVEFLITAAKENKSKEDILTQINQNS